GGFDDCGELALGEVEELDHLGGFVPGIAGMLGTELSASASPARIQSSPASTASRSRKTPEETGKGTIRSSAPSNSISAVVAGFSPRVRSDFGSSAASLIAQPVALGPKGAGSSAVSGSSQGRVTPLKDRSNACWL